VASKKREKQIPHPAQIAGIRDDRGTAARDEQGKKENRRREILRRGDPQDDND